MHSQRLPHPPIDVTLPDRVSTQFDPLNEEEKRLMSWLMMYAQQLCDPVAEAKSR